VPEGQLALGIRRVMARANQRPLEINLCDSAAVGRRGPQSFVPKEPGDRAIRNLKRRVARLDLQLVPTSNVPATVS